MALAASGLAFLMLSHLLLAAPVNAGFRAPEHFAKNEHVAYEAVKTHDGGLRVRFQFMDPFDTLQVFEHTYDYQRVLELSARYGIPDTLFEPIPVTELPNRDKVLDNGLFHARGDMLEPDLSAVSTFYGPEFTRPIARFIIASLKERGLDTRAHRIAMAMAFTQDIPYGIPSLDGDGLFRSGLSPAPLILLTGYGDCDSKATLFVGILRYLISPEDILFLTPEDEPHMLTAIRGEPGPDERFIVWEGHPYLLADVSGPGRATLGERENESQDSHVYRVEPYEAKSLPYHPDADYSLFGRPRFHIPGAGQVHIGLGRVPDEDDEDARSARDFGYGPEDAPGREP
ncbi:hypothetical protein JY651_32860 [Pyxidicoccus parkwayensis]|uniref:Transglutaminase-like domain-containing protein n=1 Tax=Pyxidicoccus parkwayensis TaxID=2813578 RepID=A0ABX7NNM6_9BACT|nr:hypothetical protein [Pyxidicoccus parkwaysis]QSQ20046.1 hypothetical protein JY651_32860 [Pyxidicoccus parkwaysis]